MIIDAHCHLGEKHLIRTGMTDLLESVAAELQIRAPESIWNGSLERLIGAMDEAV